jgi:hypothetical protein
MRKVRLLGSSKTLKNHNSSINHTTNTTATNVLIKRKNGVIRHGSGGDSNIRRILPTVTLLERSLHQLHSTRNYGTCLRIQPMSTDIELIAWTRSDFNVDMLVGCTNKKFYVLHNAQAFYCNGTLRVVVGITGIRFESPFMQVSGPHNIALFPPEHTEVTSEQGVGEVHKHKEKANLHLDHQLFKNGSTESGGKHRRTNTVDHRMPNISLATPNP